MRRMKGIWINGYKNKDKLLKYLESTGIEIESGELKQVVGEYSWMGLVPLDSPVLKKIHKTDIFSDRIEYTNEDVLAAEMLFMEMPNVMAKGDTGPDDGNDYDYSDACPLCLSGARLIPPFRIRERHLPKKRPVAETHMGEFLVAGDLANDLSCLQGSSNWLVNVEESTSGSMLAWKYIYPKIILPKFDSSTLGISQFVSINDPSAACSMCKRDCYSITYDVAFQPVYRREGVVKSCLGMVSDRRHLPDVAGTYELAGLGTRPIGSRRQIAQPMIMISQRVAQIMMKHASKWIRLTPVVLLD